MMSWRDKTLERAFAFSSMYEPLTGWVVFCDWMALTWHPRKPNKPMQPGLILVDLCSRRFHVSVGSGASTTWVLMDLKDVEVADSEIEARLMLATCQRRLLDWVEHRLARQWPEDTETHFTDLAHEIGEVIEIKVPA